MGIIVPRTVSPLHRIPRLGCIFLSPSENSCYAVSCSALELLRGTGNLE